VGHQGIHRSTTTPNIILQTLHTGCKIQLYQWTLAAQERPTAEEEEEEPSEEEVSMASTTTNPPTASRIMPRLQEIHQTLASNVDK